MRPLRKGRQGEVVKGGMLELTSPLLFRRRLFITPPARFPQKLFIQKFFIGKLVIGTGTGALRVGSVSGTYYNNIFINLYSSRER